MLGSDADGPEAQRSEDFVSVPQLVNPPGVDSLTAFWISSRNSHLADPTQPKTSDSGANTCCPHCGFAYVDVSPVIHAFERHLRFYCGCCHRVWMERQNRTEERLMYQPPLTK